MIHKQVFKEHISPEENTNHNTFISPKVTCALSKVKVKLSLTDLKHLVVTKDTEI